MNEIDHKFQIAPQFKCCAGFDARYCTALAFGENKCAIAERGRERESKRTVDCVI